MDIDMDARMSMRRRITEHFREAILTGTLATGAVIPPARALAEQFGTREANVHQALTPLVKEGLISRRPKTGTVVNALERKLERIAVYVIKDVQHPANNFTRILLKLIDEELHNLQIGCLVINENREGSGLVQIRRMAKLRQIQGVIIPAMWPGSIDELANLPVPYSCLAAANIANRVSLFDRSMAECAIRALKKLHCSKIGILSSIQDFKSPKNDIEREYQAFYNIFRKLAAAAGLDLRPEWIYTTTRDAQIGDDDYDVFAYHGFNHIWSAREKPDGLFICMDDLIRGALMATLNLKVSVPGELKLVMHRNQENKILCPLPCTFVETSIADIARGLISLVVDMFNGKPAKPIKLGYKVSPFAGDRLKSLHERGAA
jgi:DNA-binding LacI/PurR family transcriptional regulator